MTLTVGDVSEEVFERLVLAGDLDGRHAHREARARPLLVLVDEAKQPRDGARDDAQVLRALVHTDHRVCLPCKATKRGKLHVSNLIVQKITKQQSPKSGEMMKSADETNDVLLPARDGEEQGPS